MVHRGREWTGDYVTDFGRILPGLGELRIGDEAADNDDDEPEFSILTGQYRQRKAAGMLFAGGKLWTSLLAWRTRMVCG